MSDPTRVSATEGDGAGQRLAAIVERALEHEECGEDYRLLDLCGGDAAVCDAAQQALQLARRVDRFAGWRQPGDPFTGAALGDRYVVLERIGAGAMGAVYRGHDRELGRDVAIKVLHPHLFGAEAAEARFVREAQALAALRHPNVVSVHDRGKTENGAHYLVLELLSGLSLAVIVDELSARVRAGGWRAVEDTDWLRTLLAEAELEPSYLRQCVSWGIALASGLAAAHEQGIVHRDVKPSNVFITDDGRAVLLDFGIAAWADDGSLTAGDTTLGTPKYMAPEQVGAGSRTMPVVDVYSLTATLYHLVCGRAPYDGDTPRVLAALQRQDPPDPVRLRRGLPADVAAVLEVGMARDVRRRYAGMQALERDLRALLELRPVTARRLGVVGRGWRRVRRARALQAAVGAALLVIGGVATVQWWSARAAARASETQADVRALPPCATLGVRPRYHAEATLALARRLLDGATERSPERPVPWMLRAALRFDHGDRAGAARDYAEFAQRWPSALSRAVAAAFASGGGGGEMAFDAAVALPEPQDALQDLLAAHLTMRAAQWTPVERHAELYGRAVSLLRRRPEHAIAREWAFLAELQSGAVDLGRISADIARHEGRFGGSTTTSYLAGVVRAKLANRSGALADHATALAHFEAVLALVPEHYQSLNNSADRLLWLHRPAEAEVLARCALAARPTGADAQMNLCYALTRLRRFDEAEEVVAAMQVDTWERAVVAGDLALRVALQHLADGHSGPAALSAAAEASQRFEVAADKLRALGMSRRAAEAAENARRARELESGPGSDEYCTALAAARYGAAELRVIGRNLPAHMSQELRDRLQELLEDYADLVDYRETASAAPHPPAPVPDPIPSQSKE